MRVLVVEDDPKIRALLRRGLEEHRFVVASAMDGADALWRAGEVSYDAIVLDAMLPGMNGFAVCERLRATGSWTPILMLTALDHVEDRVRGLNVGADDCLVRPYDLAELVARLQALFRRGAPPRPAQLQVGDLSLDPGRRAVHRGGRPVSLTAREFSLLEYFMRHPDETLTRTRLAEHVWDDAFDGDLHVVNVYVSYLRDKIDRRFGRASLATVRGAGYCLRDDRVGAPAEPGA